MKAFVKCGNLPDAPAPTRPMRVIDPWEEKHYENAAKCPTIAIFKPKEAYRRWSEEDLKIITKMWNEGRIAKDIAPKVGGNIKATQNRITYMISKGELPKRKSAVAEDECIQIREERSYMTIPQICKKHSISQIKAKSICKKMP